jgi:hypothetical protein
MRPYLLAPRFAANRLWLAAREVPSWHIAPVRTGNVNDLITGSNIITFTNSSPAWGFNSSGVLVQPSVNVPFIEYDPATGACLGWRVWDAVTNLRSYSEAVLVANNYNVTNSTLTTQSVSTPIQGVSSASFFALNSGANTGNSTDGMTYGSGLSLANSTAYTQSGFFKLSGTNTIRLRSNVTGQVFDIVPASGATMPSGTITACTVQAAPNGWYRVSWSFTTTTSAPGNRGDHWTIKTPVADGTTGFWITGTQINTGALAPYVPTGALTASSTADVASITGAAFAGIWNQTAGTVYSDIRRLSAVPSGFPRAWQASDGTSVNRIEQTYYSNGQANVITTGGTNQAEWYPSFFAENGVKAAIAFATNDVAGASNGVITGTDNLATMPAVDRIFIGSENGSANNLRGYIRDMAILKSRRPNANLQAMTQ